MSHGREDPRPYIDKEGHRYAPEQARCMTILLRYSPRMDWEDSDGAGT